MQFRHNVQISCSFFTALVRDGFRCVISGQYDVTSVERNKELVQELKRAPGSTMCCTNCAYIFPELTNANIAGSNAQGGKVYFSPT